MLLFIQTVIFLFLHNYNINEHITWWHYFRSICQFKLDYKRAMWRTRFDVIRNTWFFLWLSRQLWGRTHVIKWLEWLARKMIKKRKINTTRSSHERIKLYWLVLGRRELKILKPKQAFLLYRCYWSACYCCSCMQEVCRLKMHEG